MAAGSFDGAARFVGHAVYTLHHHHHQQQQQQQQRACHSITDAAARHHALDIAAAFHSCHRRGRYV